MGSDESHFNVSLIVRDKVTRQYPQTTTFEKKGEPKRIRTKVPLLTSLTARPNRLTKVSSASKKQTWCLTSTETIRLIRDGLIRGRALHSYNRPPTIEFVSQVVKERTSPPERRRSVCPSINLPVTARGREMVETCCNS